MHGTGRIAKQVGGRGYYARVEVVWEDTPDTPTVVLGPATEDPWLRDEGWLDAALVGATLGMKLACASGRCTIRTIHGMTCDTTPTLVAIAAVRAVWAATGVTPDKLVAECLEACILRRLEVTPHDLEREITH